MSDGAYTGPGGRERRRPLLRKLVGAVLRRHRLQQRRTLADVARDARVSKPYLSEIERGRKEASSEVLSAVCGALHLELSDLLAAVGRDLVSPVATENDRAQPRTSEKAHDQVTNSACVLSLDAARLRRAAQPVAPPAVPPTTSPARSGEVLLLAA